VTFGSLGAVGSTPVPPAAQPVQPPPVLPTIPQPVPGQPPAAQPAPVQPAPVRPAPLEPPAVRPGAMPVAPPPQPEPRRPDAAPVAQQPAARLPTADAPVRPKPVATVERRVAQPGDRICGTCAEPNDPTRKFCRRCGASLVEARIVEEKPLPWWRRIFRRKPKQPKAFAAGERTGSMKAGAQAGLRSGRKIMTYVRLALGLLVVVGIFGYIGVPSVQKFVNEAIGGGGISGIVDNIRRIVQPTLEPVRPTNVTASEELKDHPGRLAFDTFTNTDWEANGTSPSLTITFKEPVDLGAVIVHSGAADTFVDLRRPSKLELSFPDGSSTTLTLKDEHDPQTFDLSASKVDSVKISILETNGPANAPVSLSELELFSKG
jgi:hypothetical protein